MAVNPYGADSRPEGAGPRRRTPRRVHIEDALILLAIPVLWLTVLRKTGPLVVAAQWVALAVMVLIFLVRARRLMVGRRRAEEEARKL